MEERKFIEAGFREPGPLQDLEREFVATDKGYISRQEIRERAEGLAKELEPVLAACRSEGEVASVVVNFMDARSDTLHDYIAELGEATVDSAELETYLRPIRLAMLEELGARLPAPIHMIDHRLDKVGRVWALHDGSVLKYALDKRTEGLPRSATPEEKRDRLRALTALYSLPRHPNIMYDILEIDPSGEPQEGAQIKANAPFETLEECIKRKAPVDMVLNGAMDAMQGAQFLLNNGLVLSDFAASNTAINPTTGRGMLYDFDTLRSQGDRMPNYMANYWPPERLGIVPDRSIEEPDMVFELGSLLDNVQYHYPELAKEPGFDSLHTAMTATRRADRPRLAEAIEKMQQFLVARSA
jgi:hypothetical protein